MFTIENTSDIEEDIFSQKSLSKEDNFVNEKDNCFFYKNAFIEDISFEKLHAIFKQKKPGEYGEEEDIKTISFTPSQPQYHFNILCHKKRGKVANKGKKNVNKKAKIVHLSSDFDNLLRKIQVHYLTFVIALSNDALKAQFGEKTKYNFKQIDYKNKKIISHEYVNSLKCCSIKQLLQMKISPKNSKHFEFDNLITLEKVCKESKFLNAFFDIKYLEFFNNFYYNEDKKIDRISFLGKEIIFSQKTKPFYFLIQKYESHKNLLINAVKSAYFYGYNTLIGNNSFKVIKNEEEIKLKE